MESLKDKNLYYGHINPLKDDIDDEIEELQYILSNVSNDIKFLIHYYKDKFLNEFRLDIEVNIPLYNYYKVISINFNNIITYEMIIEMLKYHIFEDLCKKVGLDRL